MNCDYGFEVGLRRLVSDKDCDQLFLWRNHPDIYAWTRQNGKISYEQHRKWFNRQFSDESMRMLGITNKSEALVGVTGLTGINEVHGYAEFSLYIGPEYQKQGLGLKALKSIVAYGFSAKGFYLDCIWGESLDGNPAQAMFLKAGLVHRGIVPGKYLKEDIHGCYHRLDAHIWSINSTDPILSPHAPHHDPETKISGT